MKILLTGASGFIGSRVAKQLVEHGHTVTSLVRSQGTAGFGDEAVADLRDAEAVAAIVWAAKPEAAIHLAWAMPSDGSYAQDLCNFASVGWSLNLARELLKVDCRRIVVAGTCAEYDPRAVLQHETATPCKPSTVYSACKHALHIALEQACASEGVELAWMRYAYVYGSGDRKPSLIPSAIRAFRSGNEFACRMPGAMHDYLYVEDVASATIAVLESNVQGPVNVGSGCPVSVRDLLERLHQIVGSGTLTFAADQTDAHRTVMDTLKLKEEVQWHPDIPINEGLARMAAFYDKEIVA